MHRSDPTPSYKVLPFDTIAPRGSKPFIEVILADNNCTFGTFLQGSIRLSPRNNFTPKDAHILLKCRERSGKYGEAAPRYLERVIVDSYLELGTPMFKGYLYTFPFSLRFPDKDWFDSCKCGLGHNTLPPSVRSTTALNGSLRCDSSYTVSIIIDQFKYPNIRYLNFSANYSGCVAAAACPSPVIAYEPLRNWMQRNTGHLLLKSQICVHSGIPAELGMAIVQVYFVQNSRRRLSEPPEINEIEYEIVRSVHWSQKPLKCLNYPSSVQVIKSAKIKVLCEWIDNAATINFNYKPGAANNLITGPLEVTYTGCLTAINYKLKVRIKGTVILVPLIIIGFGHDWSRDIGQESPALYA